MKKLVLFDIDGTLISATGASVIQWQHRVKETFFAVFNKELTFEPEPTRYNGLLDKGLFYDICKRMGIADDEFERAYPRLQDASHESLQKRINIYHRIEDAFTLITHLENTTHALGVITGNIEKNAQLKLSRAGFPPVFSFGVYGDILGSREELTKRVIPLAKKHFNLVFSPSDIIIIGDTPHDVRSGKAIGAKTIAVTTGFTATRDDLARELPDLVVDSLMDPQVLALLELSL